MWGRGRQAEFVRHSGGKEREPSRRRLRLQIVCAYNLVRRALGRVRPLGWTQMLRLQANALRTQPSFHRLGLKYAFEVLRHGPLSNAPPQPIPRRSLDCGLVGRGTPGQPAPRYPCQGCTQRSSRQCPPALCRLSLPSCAGDLAASSRGAQGRAKYKTTARDRCARRAQTHACALALALALCLAWGL